jgi:Bifunctional DNA primase/polymerase, N-terminal/Protein of unknown function (DUF3631)
MKSASPPSMLAAALDYARRGLPVLPVKPDKKPFTKHGYKDASRDPEQITRWWAEHPTALIGVPTGKTTDLFVIDVDRHSHDGFATLKTLALNLDGCPKAVTPGGGSHFYFRAGGKTLKCTAGVIGPGIDTRGDGGYIIVPPSRPDPHRPGYDFVNGVDLLAAPVVSDDVIKLLRPERRGKQAAVDLAGEAAKVRAAPHGARRDILNRAAFKLAQLVQAGKLAEDAVRKELTDAALACGLESEEIARTLDSALRDGKAKAEEDRRSHGKRKGHAPAGQAIEFAPIEPWPEPVNGAGLLDALAGDLRAYVVLEEHQVTAIALWVLHAHAIEAFSISPRLGITSPAPECGKTTLLDWLGSVVPRPLEAANISAAAVFRTIELAKPSLLIDEADHAFDDNSELRAVLNAGHHRGGSVIRLERVGGSDFVPRRFEVFGPVAIALIGELPSTLSSRAIPIGMRRKKPGERVQRWRYDEGDDTLRRMGQRWALDHVAALKDGDPVLPDELGNREGDNWRVLAAIADRCWGPLAGAGAAERPAPLRARRQCCARRAVAGRHPPRAPRQRERLDFDEGADRGTVRGRGEALGDAQPRRQADYREAAGGHAQGLPHPLRPRMGS